MEEKNKTRSGGNHKGWEAEGEGEKPQKGWTNRRAGNQKGGWGEGDGNQKLRKKIGEKQKDEKHQTNVGKPNERLEKLRRNLKTQGREVVAVAGGVISIRCR